MKIETDTLFFSDGEERVTTPKNGVSYTLTELYDMLDCRMVEVVYLDDPDTILICDEEALMVNAPRLNSAASCLAGQRIFGRVLFCDNSRFR